MFIGKTALVTGSTSGIGLGIARSLAAQGANVILNGFGDAGAIDRLKGELAELYDVQVRYDGADMSRPEAIDAMMGKALSE
ncbi:MAG: SDR family NAD(P)-dependent oxidoreductase, partial [Luteimonas sp.]|nr:SDR family NAD(P)-dependent oxidoreductase [Luteimonas sp.]